MNNVEYRDKIYFSVPGLYPDILDQQTFNFLKLKDDYPEMFYEDTIVDNIYGSFPCIWNGGRDLYGHYDSNLFKEAVAKILEKGIGVRFTFTNKFLNAARLNDTRGNLMLEYVRSLPGFTRVKCSINVGNQEAYDYFKKYYPEFYIMWSTTLDLSKIEDINKYTENDFLVPSYNINNQFNIIDQLIHPEKLEFLLFEGCKVGCPVRSEHYAMRNLQQLGFSFGKITESTFCLKQAKKIAEDINVDLNLEKSFKPTKDFENKIYNYPQDFSDILKLTHNHGRKRPLFYDQAAHTRAFISNKAIREDYLPRGINKFKIPGRNESISVVLERFLLYFVKPEYINTVRTLYLNSCFPIC